MFVKKASAAVLAALFLVFAPQPRMAQSSDRVAQEDDRLGRVFSDLERRVIREVLTQTGVIEDQDDDDDAEEAEDEDRSARGEGARGGKGRGRGLPPGLARRENLPPGLQRQLDERGRFPPGLERQALPEELEGRLPERTDTERVIVGDDVVLIERGTDLVLDVIRDVLRGGSDTTDESGRR